MQRIIFLVSISLCLACSKTAARDITFCGEKIPIDNAFVANKLMNVIRSQIKNIDLQRVRNESQRYFPIIQYYLSKSNMPDDLKYIPIIESGFRNATSKAGAQGFWQLMEETAKEWGLQVNGPIDERNDIYKSTIAAMRELARVFKSIRRDHKIASWVLTAAAYNWGIGNVYTKIESGSKNYFSMTLNPETAVYVYKIVAIKELFEYPELYIKNFNYNVFSHNRPPQKSSATGDDKKDLPSISLEAKKDAIAPEDASIKSIEKPADVDLKKAKEFFSREARLVSAQVVGKYRDFKDGDQVIIKLDDNLQTFKGFQRKGTELTGKGWIIGERVFVDLGFNSNNVILYDTNSEQGIALNVLQNREQVILRVQN